MTEHEILIGDSTQLLKDYPDNFFQLVVTSPPYPMVEMWDKSFTAKDDVMKIYIEKLREVKERNELFFFMDCIYHAMHNYLKPIWEQLYRTLCTGGIACIVIGDAFRSVKDEKNKSIGGTFRLYPNHAMVINNFQNLGFHVLPYILWKKPTNKPNSFLGSGFVPPNAYVTADIEYILIFRKGDMRSFPSKDPLRYESAYTKEERDVWFSQIWEGITGEKQDITGLDRRSGAFPLEIPSRLIRMFSLKKDWILDPFAGSGTTAVAAKMHGRYSVSIEINELCKPIMEKRLEDASTTRLW